MPSHYFSILEKSLVDHNPDVIGGPDFLPPEPTATQVAYAFAQSEPFVTGHTSFRHKRRSGINFDATESDLILCNLWIRAGVFESFSFPSHYFRNEENYLLSQLKSEGKKLIAHPDLWLCHEKKSDLKKIFFACYRSGFYRRKMMVDLKQSGSILFWVPMIFVLYLIALPFVYKSLLGSLIQGYVILVILHVLKAVGFSYNFNVSSTKVQIMTFIIIPLIHISYGLGLLTATLRLNLGNRL